MAATLSYDRLRSTLIATAPLLIYCFSVLCVSFAAEVALHLELLSVY